MQGPAEIGNDENQEQVYEASSSQRVRECAHSAHEEQTQSRERRLEQGPGAPFVLFQGTVPSGFSIQPTANKSDREFAISLPINQPVSFTISSCPAPGNVMQAGSDSSNPLPSQAIAAAENARSTNPDQQRSAVVRQNESVAPALVAEDILPELANTCYYRAILDLIAVGAVDDFGGGQAVDLQHSSLSPGGIEESIRICRKQRITHFGIRLRGEGWKYTEHCEDLGKRYRSCKFCSSKVPVRHHTRLLKHLLGMNRQSPCKISRIALEELLETSPTARKLKMKMDHQTRGTGAVANPGETETQHIDSVAGSSCRAETSSATQVPPTSEPAAVGGIQPSSKRRRVTPVQTSGSRAERTQSHTWIEELREKIMDAVMKIFILSTRPFQLFEKLSRNSPSIESELLVELVCQGIERHLPNSYALVDQLLNQYHDAIDRHIQQFIIESLQAGGFATVMFNVWDDIRGQSVVNVLLKVHCGIDGESSTFLINLEHTGSSRLGPREYVDLVERSLEPFGTSDRICAITSDNTESCIYVRNLFASRHIGSTAVNDQSHVADLLIQDVADLAWVGDVIDKVLDIGIHISVRRSLTSRLSECIDDFNKVIGRGFNRLEDELKESSGQPERTQALEANLCKARALHRAAVVVEPISATRFTNFERVLNSFLRARPALFKLMEDAEAEKRDFDRNLDKVTASPERKRTEDFENLISSRKFLGEVASAHSVLSVLRRYLQFFDSDRACIQDVLPLTFELEKNISQLRIAAWKKMQVLKVYRKWRDGPVNEGTKVLLLQDVHWAAYALDPNSDLSIVPQWMLEGKLRNHIRIYCQGKFRDERMAQLKEEQFMSMYSEQQFGWRQMRLAGKGASLELYSGRPLQYWLNCFCRDTDFQEFAQRTLACSPSSCATERSFSTLKRIKRDHPKLRRRRMNDKVERHMFCYWNLLVTSTMNCIQLWNDEQQIAREQIERTQSSSESSEGSNLQLTSDGGSLVQSDQSSMFLDDLELSDDDKTNSSRSSTSSESQDL